MPGVGGPGVYIDWCINEEVICEIDYKQEQQGLVIIDEEIPSHYYKMCIAIANTFNYKYASMILESYIIALIKHMKCFYLIDPHARNCLGMPNPNGMFVFKLDLNLKHQMCVHDVLGIRMK